MRQNIQNPNYWEAIAMRYEQLQQQQHSHQNRSNCKVRRVKRLSTKFLDCFIHYKTQGYNWLQWITNDMPALNIWQKAILWDGKLYRKSPLDRKGERATVTPQTNLSASSSRPAFCTVPLTCVAQSWQQQLTKSTSVLVNCKHSYKVNEKKNCHLTRQWTPLIEDTLLSWQQPAEY